MQKQKFSHKLIYTVFDKVFEDYSANRVVPIYLIRYLLEDFQKMDNSFDPISNGIFNRLILLVSSYENPNAKQMIELVCVSEIIQIIVNNLDADAQRTITATYLPAIEMQQRAHLYFLTGSLDSLKPTINLEGHFERLIYISIPVYISINITQQQQRQRQ